jgi:hypothetical protein
LFHSEGKRVKELYNRDPTETIIAAPVRVINIIYNQYVARAVKNSTAPLNPLLSKAATCCSCVIKKNSNQLKITAVTSDSTKLLPEKIIAFSHN